MHTTRPYGLIIKRKHWKSYVLFALSFLRLKRLLNVWWVTEVKYKMAMEGSPIHCGYARVTQNNNESVCTVHTMTSDERHSHLLRAVRLTHISFSMFIFMYINMACTFAYSESIVQFTCAFYSLVYIQSFGVFCGELLAFVYTIRARAKVAQGNCTVIHRTSDDAQSVVVVWRKLYICFCVFVLWALFDVVCHPNIYIAHTICMHILRNTTTCYLVLTRRYAIHR